MNATSIASPRTRLPITTYDGNRFSWKNKVGRADASDLGLPPGEEPGSRVWSDGCDVGFNVRSHRTGKVHTFVLIGEDRDKEGFVLGWIFASLADLDTVVIVCND